ncbi:unnamed protein product [Schistosoma curassoni]|uniref:PRE_C2HC domain-containing protein n=1 Tax=Schistosoma curassoni TaxID=6186 RepID=A0A183JIN7_9TREM|nr:unnamed protein product [Schistosoma curassoni]
MQQAWLMPVYDRYTIVVQLFNLRSRTPEAKLQAKLAEIGLLRARIPAFFETPNMIKCLVDRSDFATKERLLQILNGFKAVFLSRRNFFLVYFLLSQLIVSTKIINVTTSTSTRERQYICATQNNENSRGI